MSLFRCQLVLDFLSPKLSNSFETFCRRLNREVARCLFYQIHEDVPTKKVSNTWGGSHVDRVIAPDFLLPERQEIANSSKRCLEMATKICDICWGGCFQVEIGKWRRSAGEIISDVSLYVQPWFCLNACWQHKVDNCSDCEVKVEVLAKTSFCRQSTSSWKLGQTTPGPVHKQQEISFYCAAFLFSNRCCSYLIRNAEARLRTLPKVCQVGFWEELDWTD